MLLHYHPIFIHLFTYMLLHYHPILIFFTPSINFDAQLENILQKQKHVLQSLLLCNPIDCLIRKSLIFVQISIQQIVQTVENQNKNMSSTHLKSEKRNSDRTDENTTLGIMNFNSIDCKFIKDRSLNSNPLSFYFSSLMCCMFFFFTFPFCTIPILLTIVNILQTDFFKAIVLVLNGKLVSLKRHKQNYILVGSFSSLSIT